MTDARWPELPEAMPRPAGDLLPPSERNYDLPREAAIDALASQPARPLSDEEQEAALRDTPRAERVYAPASARVPKAPVPGHERLIERGLRSQSEERRRAARDLARQVGAEPPGR